jgi:nucleoid DNA-binding protein
MIAKSVELGLAASTQRKDTMTKKKLKIEPRLKLTLTMIIAEIAARTRLPTEVVRSVLKSLADIMDEELFGPGAPGVFILPFMAVVLKVVLRPALPRRKGRNPATGQEIWLKPREASWKPKAAFLKDFKQGMALKEPPDEG